MRFFKAQNKRLLAIVLMSLGSITISFNGLVLRNIEFADNWTVIFYRAVSFTTAVFVFILFNYKKEIFTQITKVGPAGLLAGMFLGLANICFILSMTTTTVANSVFTISLIPFITAIFALYFLKETLARITIYTMIGAFIGVTIMLFESINSGDLIGNILAFITAVSFSCFTLILRVNRNLEMVPCLIVSGLIAMAVSFVLKMGSLQISMNDLLLSFLLGGILSAFVNCCFIFATKYLLAAEATLFFFIEIALSPMWVWLFLNEMTPTNTLFGGVLILISLLIRALYLKRP